jgi:hypothetical protein
MNPAPDRPEGRRLLEGAGMDGRGARLVARTLFREMQRSGFTHRQVLAVADELLGCLCGTARPREEAGPPTESWEPDGTGD